LTRTYGSGVHSATSGFCGGGQIITGSTSSTRIDELIFSNDTLASITSGLNNAEHGACSFSSGAKGFFCGGCVGATATYITNIDKLTFATKTVAANGTGLTIAHQGGPSYGSDDAGYVNGGTTSGATFTSTAQKLSFATEALSTLSNMSYPRSAGAGNASYVAGYASGGYSGSSYLSSVEKLSFSTDARTALVSTLVTTLSLSAAHDHLNAPLGSA
jgi:hypothetical protein